jgi:fluoride exporter
VNRPPLTPTVLGAVALGGATGAAARATLGSWFPDPDGFPWTTLTINVVGSFLLAALPALAVVRRHRVVAVGLGPGLLGGFTTLSAYAEQGRVLIADGSSVIAAAYLLGTLAACLVAVSIATHLSTPAAQHEFEDEEGFE